MEPTTAIRGAWASLVPINRETITVDHGKLIAWPAAIAYLRVVANAMETVVPPSTRVRNFVDARPVKLDELESVIASLAIETSRPQMGEMAREIAASFIDMGTEVWGDMRIHMQRGKYEGGWLEAAWRAAHG